VELGYIDYDTILVRVHQPPTIVKSENVSTCKFPVMIGNAENNDNYKYEWSPKVHLDDPFVKTPQCSLPANVSMQYILSILDTLTGCYSFDTIFVELANLDGFEIEGSQFICEGSTSTLRVKLDFATYK